jgi:type I restriction enzyme S subunit
MESKTKAVSLDHFTKNVIDQKEWITTPLSECIQEVKNVSVVPHKKDKYVGLENLKSGNYHIKDYAPSRNIKSICKIFEKGYLLYGKLRPNLDKAAIANFDGVCSTEIMVLNSKINTFNEFIIFHIHSDNFIQYVSNKTFGTKMPRTSMEIIGDYTIPLPPFIEQHKIAAILSTVDASIEATERIIAQIEQLKKGLIQYIFHDLMVKKCVEILLADVSLSYKNGIYKEPHYYGTGYPSIRMYNIINGYVNKINAPLLDVTNEELEFYSLKKGDLLINRVNSIDLVGKAGIVKDELGPVTFESKNIRVRLNEKLILPEYMSIFVQSCAYTRQIRMMVKSAIAQSTINQDDLDRLLIPLPSLDEQQKIVEILKSIDRKILIEIDIRNNLVRIKKGLMQVLLTGKVRVKVDS